MKSFFTKLTFSLFLALGMIVTAAAQKTVSGVISDAANGESLIGANVLVKGTNVGTITDIDGAYSINVCITNCIKLRH